MSASPGVEPQLLVVQWLPITAWLVVAGGGRPGQGTAAGRYCRCSWAGLGWAGESWGPLLHCLRLGSSGTQSILSRPAAGQPLHWHCYTVTKLHCYTNTLATVLQSYRTTVLQCYSRDRGEVLEATGSRGTLLRILAW